MHKDGHAMLDLLASLAGFCILLIIEGYIRVFITRTQENLQLQLAQADFGFQ